MRKLLSIILFIYAVALSSAAQDSAVVQDTAKTSSGNDGKGAGAVFTGTIVDENGIPFPFVNVYIEGTAVGTSTDGDGNFSIDAEGEILKDRQAVLCFSMLGYEDIRLNAIPGRNVRVRMRPVSTMLDQATVVGSTYMLKGNSSWNGINSVDLVTNGSFTGNLATTLQMLPGTQESGESGMLRVRGGSDRETQVYIDEMRVLFPYSASAQSSPSMLRYSPFIFEGINFSTGGYSSEYADGLSGILPLNTKDRSETTKVGINVSSVGASGGGTKSFDKGSISMNTDYIDLRWHNLFLPDRTEWIEPYHNLAAALQWRYRPGAAGTLKSFANYDRTCFVQNVDGRAFSLSENTLFANLTYRNTDVAGWSLFAGGAFSMRLRDCLNAATSGDKFTENEGEIHLKAKAGRRVGGHFRINFGVESLLHRYIREYILEDTDAYGMVSYTQAAGYGSVAWSPSPSLYFELSGRAEYFSFSKSLTFNPRIAVNWQKGAWKVSAIIGRYSQVPENRWLLKSFEDKGTSQPEGGDKARLKEEHCMHYVAGTSYSKGGRLLRGEIYYKDYSHLARVKDGITESSGYGFARGIDLYYSDNRTPVPNLDWTIAYSWGQARRLYGEYTEITEPPYFTAHNLSVTVRYFFKPARTIISISDRFASGRPYHNVDRSGIMNDHLHPYNSFDAGLTFLVHPKFLIYFSTTNLLGRKNVYGYEDGKYVVTNNDRSFYIGLFITLHGNTAYDVSNF